MLARRKLIGRIIRHWMKNTFLNSVFIFKLVVWPLMLGLSLKS